MAYSCKSTDIAHDKFTMYISLKRIWIEALTEEGERYLIFNRETEGLKIRLGKRLTSRSVKKEIFGILGVIKLILCRYLIVITERSRVDTGKKVHRLSNVWRIDKVNLVPLAPGLRTLTASQKASNDELINMTLSAFNTKDFYYSRKYDLGTSLATTAHQIEKPSPVELLPVNTFVWNQFLLRDLFRIEKTDIFCVPVINGFVGVRYVRFQEEEVVLSIVSRRDARRVGARFFTRGADPNGAVANFVETEMIVTYANNVTSFLILRGSTPLEWFQRPNFSFSPRPVLSRVDYQHLAFYNHFEPIKGKYGNVVFIELSAHTMHGKGLHELCKDMARSDTGIEFMEFDAHQPAQEPLDPEVAKEIMDIGYTWISLVATYQKGVVYISSLDATDYTNVAQCRLAKVAFDHMVKTTLGPDLYKPPSAAGQSVIDQQFNELWLENGDTLSLQYTGTISLKGYLLQPIDKSKHRRPLEWELALERWYVNNMADGFKQDSLDLILGNVIISRNYSAPRHFLSLFLRFLLPGVMTMTTAQMLNIFYEYLDNYEYKMEGVCLTVWALVFIVAWILFIGLRHAYVDRPTLTQKK